MIRGGGAPVGFLTPRCCFTAANEADPEDAGGGGGGVFPLFDDVIGAMILLVLIDIVLRCQKCRRCFC